MNDSSAALERLSAALSTGDLGPVMACFAADARLDLMCGEDRLSLNGSEIREAVDLLLTGFGDIKLTAVSRQVSASQLVEESVISGSHTGTFAGAPPTSARVRVNVKLSATSAPDSRLQSLWFDVDTRALFAQIAGTDDVVGVTGALVAAARERHGAAPVVYAVSSPAARAAHRSSPHRSSPHRVSRSRHRWAGLGAAVALLLIAIVVWRPGPTGPAIEATADQGVRPQAFTNTPTTSTVPPATGSVPKTVTPPVLPVIRIAAAKSVPHVQQGKQVVLKSDVLFGFDSAALTPAAQTALTRVAKQISSTGVTGTIQINGYTDDTGSVAYDVALSRARALAVAGALQRGLAGRPVTLAPQGFGRANPIAPNTSDATRGRNRRVTIVLPTLR